MRALRSFRFYFLRTLAAQPKATVIVLTCVAIFLISLAVRLSVANQRREGFIELNASRTQASHSATAVASSGGKDLEVVLPLFVSADTVRRFIALLSRSGITAEEISYALDDVHDQPYLRYRIAMSVKSSYPQLRKSLAALAIEIPNATLDTLRCSRDTPAAPALACELTFSAFYRRGSE